MKTKALNRSIQFVLSTFLLTYTCWMIFMYVHFKYGVKVFDDSPFGILMLLGLFSPSIMGIVFRLKDGSISIKMLSAKTLRFLPLSILLPIAFVILDQSITTNIEKTLSSGISVDSILIAFAMSIVFGGLEELGWRAYLLPQLLKFMSPSKANISIATIWTLWHVPLFFLPGAAQYQQNFIIFMMGMITLSSMMTIIWLKTKSPLLAILTHTTYNAMAVLGFTSSNTLIQIVVSTIIAIASLIILQRMTKRDMI